MQITVFDMDSLDLKVDTKTMFGTVSIHDETLVKAKVKSIDPDVAAHNLLSALAQRGVYQGMPVGLYDAVANRVCTGREKARLVWQAETNVSVPLDGIPATVLENGCLSVQEETLQPTDTVSWFVAQELLDAFDN